MPKTKKPSQLNSYYKIALLSVTAVFILLFAVQAALIKNLYSRVDSVSYDKVQSLIVQAVRDMENDPVVDFQSGREFIPENRLVLPPSGELNVSYYSDSESVTFSDRANVGQAIAIMQNGYSIDSAFENVPNLQACSRQVVLQFNDNNNDGLVYLQDKKLADGRTIYLYENDGCQGDSSKLFEYLKQAESY